MLGVLPFVEDPYLSWSAALALPQHLPPWRPWQRNAMVCELAWNCWHFRQSRTWIHDNHCDLTIKSDWTGIAILRMFHHHSENSDLFLKLQWYLMQWMYWPLRMRNYLESTLVLWCEYTQILLGLIKFGFPHQTPNTRLTSQFNTGTSTNKQQAWLEWN